MISDETHSIYHSRLNNYTLGSCCCRLNFIAVNGTNLFYILSWYIPASLFINFKLCRHIIFKTIFNDNHKLKHIVFRRLCVWVCQCLTILNFKFFSSALVFVAPRQLNICKLQNIGCIYEFIFFHFTSIVLYCTCSLILECCLSSRIWIFLLKCILLRIAQWTKKPGS